LPRGPSLRAEARCLSRTEQVQKNRCEGEPSVFAMVSSPDVEQGKRVSSALRRREVWSNRAYELARAAGFARLLL